MEYTVVATPVGELLAVAGPTGLAALSYLRGDLHTELDRIADRTGREPVQRADGLSEIRRQLDEYFDGSRRDFDLPLDWSLAPGGFARQVLKVVATIPWGQTLSYGQVAAEAGSPRAARAVGNAMRRNPIAVVVPCHRVLHGSGGIGGYMGGAADGLTIKRHLLNLEGCAPTLP